MLATAAFASANAASFKWTAGQMYGPDNALWSGTVSLYCGETLVDTASTTTGTVANKTFTMDAVTDQTYYFHVVLSDGSKEFKSSTVSAVAQEAATSPIGFGSLKTATQTASNWQAVPEPTSGLLLLLGMAGLALKRKRT